MSVAALPLLSPLVTRILELSGFPSELKTRDLQQVFAQWEDDKGGFKIKWVDDTTALIIFAEPAVAKKAYLHTLMSPPASLINPSGAPAKIRPYDKDDASAVIASVQNRQRSRSNAGGVLPAYGVHGSPSRANAELATPSTVNGAASSDSPPRGIRGHAPSSSFGRAFGHRRNQSGSNPNLPPKPVAAALFDAANGGPSPANRVLANSEGINGSSSSTLPPNPIASAVAVARGGQGNGSAVSLAGESGHVGARAANGSVEEETTATSSAAPSSGAGSGRIGDAGKRLVAGALGVRHPGVARRSNSSSPSGSRSSTPQPRSSTPTITEE